MQLCSASLLALLSLLACLIARSLTSNNVAHGSGVGKDVEDILGGLLLVHFWGKATGCKSGQLA